MSSSLYKTKRRWESDESDRPRKKLSSNAENIRLMTLQDVSEWSPALVFTPGLNYDFEHPMDVYTRSRSIRGESTKQEILLHSGTHPKLDYVAQEEKAGDAGSLLQHYVAVHDPQSGDTQVVPVKKLVLRSTLQSVRRLEERQDDAPRAKTAMDSRIMLGHAFGTKKSQKALRSLTENAILASEKIERDSKGKLVLADAAAVVIDTMGEATSLPTKEALQEAIDEAKPRPKANLEAETPADVYRLDSMFGQDILSRLDCSSWRRAIKKKQDVQTVSRYVSYRVIREGNLGIDHKLKALRLLLLLVEWRRTFKTGKRDTYYLSKDEDLSEDKISDFDPILMGKIRRKFAPENTLSPWHMDNISTHVCALALIVDNFVVDISDLRHDLGLENKKVIQYFKELGCRVKPPSETEMKDFDIKTKAEASSHSISKLKIPLVFPKMRAPLRRR